MKISMVGSGRVGSTTLFNLLLEGLAQELVVVDILTERAQGEALDLLHGTHLSHRCKIYQADYDGTAGSDICIITAGIPRAPGETRLDLLKKNVALMDGVLEQLTKYSKDAFIIMVANPVDVLTYQAIKRVGPAKVIGTGTLLDSTRFRSLLGDRLNVSPDQIYAYMLGEHGDSMAAITSSATAAGMPLAQFPGYSKEMVDDVVHQTRFGGAEVIKKKGGTFYAVAPMITALVRAIVNDERRVIPVSTILDTGFLGMRDASLSLPTLIGKHGREAIVPPPMDQSEQEALLASYTVLRGAIQEVGL
ncbi:MAG: malate dehydrogenase [Chloroflexi bacterium]|nr:malate dehydrogenase [Chloroflexota bacterium]